VPDDTLEAFSGGGRPAVETPINLMRMHRPLDHNFDFFETNRLAIIVKCSEPYGSKGVSVVIVPGDDDYTGGGLLGQESFY
jgi:hypothetical protein